MRSSQRGRAGKIVKSSGPSAAARNRLARGNSGAPGVGGASQNLTAHDSQAILDPDADADAVTDVNYGDLPLTGDQYAAAAASAALHANMADQDGEKEDNELMDDQDAVDPDLSQHPEHMDLNTAANILANGNGGGQDLGAMQQHLHHPHQHQLVSGHQSHAVDPSLGGKTTEAMSGESGYVGLNVESQLAKRLAAWPGLRLAHQRRPEQQLNLQRRSNVEALFAHIAGKLAKVQCKNCHKGHGPWNSCVIVEGQMCGSCANCWFNASGARCSFHETRQNVIPAGTASHGHVVDPNGNAFAVPQQMLGSQHAGRIGNLAMNPSPLTNDPTLRYNIERAINEVRAADERARHLISIDVAAKQLALQMVAYEDFLANNQAQQVPQLPVQQVQQVQQAAQAQQVMGDENSA